MKRRPDFPHLREHQRGAAAVEFALVAIVFFMLLIGIVEMGRVLFTWNAVAEATRYGARVAVVCPLNDPAILNRMQKVLPTESLSTENVSISYLPSGCSVSTCQQVTVSIKPESLKVTPMIPNWVGQLWVPPFTTTLPRESMLNNIDGHPNPVCT
jgi:Flp pilus assembly protein TadG